MDWAFLNEQLLDNPLREYLVCAGILLAGLLFKRLTARFISTQTFYIVKGKVHDYHADKFVSLFRKPVEQFLTLFILYAAFDRLRFPAVWDIAPIEKRFGLRWLIDTVFEIAVIITVTRLVLSATEYAAYVFLRRDDQRVNKEVVSFLKEFGKVIIIVFSFFVILRMAFGVNIPTLVTSLGIGGLAVALAAQDTLANLFASFTIFLDRPFNVGDSIEAGEIKGTIEKVGFRTTRIRTIDKSLLIVPNKKLVDLPLNNVTRFAQRRVHFAIQLTYRNDVADLNKVIEGIRDNISRHPMTDDATVHFTDFDPSALIITITYFVNTDDYWKMIKVKEEINFRILAIVEQHRCDFAFRAQQVYLNEKGKGNREASHFE